jgi:hypothetical protein
MSSSVKSHMLDAGILFGLFFDPEYVGLPPKPRLDFSGLYGITSQTIELTIEQSCCLEAKVRSAQDIPAFYGARSSTTTFTRNRHRLMPTRT